MEKEMFNKSFEQISNNDDTIKNGGDTDNILENFEKLRSDGEENQELENNINDANNLVDQLKNRAEQISEQKNTYAQDGVASRIQEDAWTEYTKQEKERLEKELKPKIENFIDQLKKLTEESLRINTEGDHLRTTYCNERDYIQKNIIKDYFNGKKTDEQFQNQIITASKQSDNFGKFQRELLKIKRDIGLFEFSKKRIISSLAKNISFQKLDDIARLMNENDRQKKI